MKIWEKLKKNEKEITKYQNQLEDNVGKIEIKICANSYSIKEEATIFLGTKDDSYKKIELPIEDWNKIKEKIDRMLNLEVNEAGYEPSKY